MAWVDWVQVRYLGAMASYAFLMSALMVVDIFLGGFGRYRSMEVIWKILVVVNFENPVKSVLRLTFDGYWVIYHIAIWVRVDLEYL